MKINDVLSGIYNLKSFRRRENLERMEKILSVLGNPHKKFKSIHIAGTNGKGSVSTFIYSILREAGLNAAIYTSPHLVKFNERIKVMDKDISDADLVRLADFINSKVNGLDITFFEFTTALAFLYFAEKKVDIAVIEVGMGGRLDATNTITPLVSVITHIGMDHEKHLGSSTIQIAREKAGIIKENIPVVTAEKDKEVLNLFEEVCHKKNASLFRVGKDLTFIKKDDLKFLTRGKIESEFSTSMLGDYQIENASTSILAISVLNRECGYNISAEDIKKGVKKAFIHGRLEKIGNILLDGAHNPDAVRELVKYLKSIDKKIILILGIKEGKNIAEIASLIAPLVSAVILTKSSFKAANPDILAKEVRKYNSNIFKTDTPNAALKLASSMAKKEDIILVTGSLYLVGDIYAILKPDKSDKDY